MFCSLRKCSQCPDSVVDLAGTVFSWAGFNEEAAAKVLARIFPLPVVQQKLLPLAFEWILRSVAAERRSFAACTTDACKQSWAKSRGFRWVPTSAKTSLIGGAAASLSQSSDNHASDCCSRRSWHAIVTWTPVLKPAPHNVGRKGGARGTHADSDLLRGLSASSRRARLRLVASCGLFAETARRPAELRSVVSRLSTECPVELRRDAMARRGRSERFPLIGLLHPWVRWDRGLVDFRRCSRDSVCVFCVFLRSPCFS